MESSSWFYIDKILITLAIAIVLDKTIIIIIIGSGVLVYIKSVAMPVTVIIKHSQLLTIIARGRVWVTFVVLLGGKFGRSEVTSSWRVGVLIANSLSHMKAE